MEWYLPILIFFARVTDVSIGTVRTILVIGGHKYAAAFLGFLESAIWLTAVAGVISHVSNFFALIGYAGGFATGVLVGMLLEDKIALGYRLVRAVNRDPGVSLADALRKKGYVVTQLDGRGMAGPVEVIFAIVKRRKLDEVRRIIGEAAPDTFWSVERAERPVTGTSFATSQTRFARPNWMRPFSMRK